MRGSLDQEKESQRNLIKQQVEEFLKSGGEIDDGVASSCIHVNPVELKNKCIELLKSGCSKKSIALKLGVKHDYVSNLKGVLAANSSRG